MMPQSNSFSCCDLTEDKEWKTEYIFSTDISGNLHYPIWFIIFNARFSALTSFSTSYNHLSGWYSQRPGSRTERPAADWWRCFQSPAPAWVETTCWRWFFCPPCVQSRPGWPRGWRCAEASASILQSPAGENRKRGIGAIIGIFEVSFR